MKVVEWDTEGVINTFANRIIAGFDKNLGPHIEASAREFAPVSKGTTRRKFDLTRLARLNEVPTERQGRLLELQGIREEEGIGGLFDALRSSDIDLFRFRGRGGSKIGPPVEIAQKRGTIKGRFAKPGGFLRKNIKWAGARRSGSKVIGTLRSGAPYSKWVHGGFTHKGGKAIAPNPYLWKAALKHKADLKQGSTYRG